MQIIMPKLGLTMTHGTITEWLKAPGDAVKAEEALCAYETEKVTLELSAPEDGVLAEILAPAGATVPAGAAVCEFVTKDEGRRTNDGGQGQGTGVRSQESGDAGILSFRFPCPLSGQFGNQLPVPSTPPRKPGPWRGNMSVDSDRRRRQRAGRPGAGRGMWKPLTPPASLRPSRRRRWPGASPRPKALTCGALPAPAPRGRSRGRTWSRRPGVRGQGTGIRDQGSGVRSRPQHRSCRQPRLQFPVSSFRLPASSFQLPVSSLTPPSAAPSPSG